MDVLTLRNRVMHFEAVYRRDLWRDQAKIYRLLGYISPKMAKELQARDQMSDVLRRRDADWTPGGEEAR